MDKLKIGEEEFTAPIFTQRVNLIKQMIEKDSNFIEVMLLYEKQYKEYFENLKKGVDNDATKKIYKLHMRLRTHLATELNSIYKNPSKFRKWNSEVIKQKIHSLLNGEEN